MVEKGGLFKYFKRVKNQRPGDEERADEAGNKDSSAEGNLGRDKPGDERGDESVHDDGRGT